MDDSVKQTVKHKMETTLKKEGKTSKRKILDIPLQLLHNHHNLLHTFPKLTDALEILFVLKGIKPVARQQVHQDELWRLHGFCLAHGLSYVPSPFKIVENTTIIVTPDSPMEGSYFVYVSRDDEKARQAAFFESIRNDEKLGELLGYPSCCVSFYKTHYEKALGVGDEYCQFTLANSGDGPYSFLTNNMLRFFEIGLLSHFPCSFDCKESVQLGKKMIDAVEENNSQLGKYLRNAMKGPIMYHHGTGIHALKGYVKKGNVISFGVPWLTSPNRLHGVLSLCNNVRVLGKNHVELRRDEQVIEDISGEQIGLAFFV